MRKFIYAICVVTVVLFFSCASSKSHTVRIADLDPFELGKAEAGFSKLIGSDLNQQIVEVNYDARTDEACLNFKHQGVKFSIRLNKELRDAYIRAVDKYNNDFEARKLINRNNATSKTYGKIYPRMFWGVFFLDAEARPPVFLGYRFGGDNPYFTLNVREAVNIRDESDMDVPSSFQYIIWFNRQQARALGDLLAQATIDAGLDAQNLPEESNSPDVY